MWRRDLCVRLPGGEAAATLTSQSTWDEVAEGWADFVVEPDGAARDATLPVAATPGAYLHTVSEVAAERSARKGFVFRAAGLVRDGQVTAILGGDTVDLLVAAGRSGWGYVADQLLVVGYDGIVTAFPRPLVTTGDDGSRVVHPSHLGLSPQHGSFPLTRLIVVDQGPDHVGRPARERMASLEAVQAMASRAVALRRRTRPLQRLGHLLEVAGGVERLSLRTSEQLPEALDAPAAALPDATPWTPMPRSGSKIWQLADGRVRRSPIRDGLDEGDRALVLPNDVPVMVQGIGLVIRDQCGDAPDLDTLVGRVVEELGDHPDARALVEEALVTLQLAGVAARNAPEAVSRFWPPPSARRGTPALSPLG